MLKLTTKYVKMSDIDLSVLTSLQVALDTLVDNVAMLGIEACLLHDLPSVIPGDAIYDMDDQQISLLAAEPADAAERRDRLQRETDVLKDTAKVFYKYAYIGQGRCPLQKPITIGHHIDLPTEPQPANSDEPSSHYHSTTLPTRSRESSDQPPPYSGFGATPANHNKGGLFARSSTPAQPHPSAPGSSGLFGSNAGTTKPGPTQSAGLFEKTSAPNNGQDSLFGSGNTQSNSGGLFGANNNSQSNSGGLFGADNNSQSNNASHGGFGSSRNSAFGATLRNDASQGGFGSGMNQSNSCEKYRS